MRDSSHSHRRRHGGLLVLTGLLSVVGVVAAIFFAQAAPPRSTGDHPDAQTGAYAPGDLARAQGTGHISREDFEASRAFRPASAESQPQLRTSTDVLGGVVVDDVRSTPVPFLELQVFAKDGSAGSRMSSMTDAGGRFQLSTPLTSIRSIFVKEQSTGLQLREDFPQGIGSDGDRGIRLIAPAGPTYLLDVDAPPGVESDNLKARLTVRASAGARDVWTSVNAKPRPWIRFPKWTRSKPSYRSEGVYLVVHGESGKYVGSSLVGWTAGFSPQPVRVQLKRRPTLTGIVVDLMRNPIAGAFVHVRADSEVHNGATSGDPSERVITDNDGRFVVPALLPQQYGVDVSAEGFAPCALKVDINESGPNDVTVTMGRGEEISGVFVSAFRPPEGYPLVRLRRSGTGSSMWIRPIPVERPQIPSSTPYRASFRFKGLEAGSYEMDLVAPANRHERLHWSPAVMTVTAPSPELSFTINTPDPVVFAVGFKPFDRNTRDRIDVYDAIDLTVPTGRGQKAKGKGIAAITRRQFGKSCGFYPIGKQGPLRWIVLADGYRPVVGDESAFNNDSVEVGNNLRLAEITLERGWGMLLQVFVDAGNGEMIPLRNVPVIADGDRVGMTDVNGLCILSLPQEPSKLDVMLEGYHVADTPPSDEARKSPFRELVLERD